MIQQCSVLIKKRLLTIGISGSKLLSIYVFVFPWESFVLERCFEYVFFSFTVCVLLLLLQFQIKAYLSFVDGTLVDKKDDNNSR